MKKFVAYRVVTQKYNRDTCKIDNGWFMQGQRKSDLNWEFIGTADSEESAHERLISIRETENKGSKWCPIYNPSGYGYRE